jgi:membrane-associated phospholipid phosphatase
MREIVGGETPEPELRYRKMYQGNIHAVLRFTPILYPVIAIAVSFALASRDSFELLVAYLVGFAIVSLIVKIIKKIVKQPRPGHKLFGADNTTQTDNEEQCGHTFKVAGFMTTKPKGPGMPSGHAALSAYTLVFMLLIVTQIDMKLDVKSWQTRGYLTGAIIVAFLCIATMVHRIILICHTPAQVLVGALIGVGIAFGAYYALKAAQPYVNKLRVGKGVSRHERPDETQSRSH